MLTRNPECEGAHTGIESLQNEVGIFGALLAFCCLLSVSLLFLFPRTQITNVAGLSAIEAAGACNVEDIELLLPQNLAFIPIIVIETDFLPRVTCPCILPPPDLA